MIHNEIHRDERFDHAGILAQFGHSGAHGCQIHQQGNSREILKDDAGYHKRDLLGADSGRLPVGQSFDIRLCDPLAVTVPQDRFQDHPDRDRQTAHIRYPGFFQCRQTVVFNF